MLRELYRRNGPRPPLRPQATALTKQGRLAVYPSSRGQEACQVARGPRAARPTDWVFPTYRESMALVARGIDPVEVLTLLRGDWHCGYDPADAPHRTAVHPAGHPDRARRRLAHGEARQGRDTVALAFIGDGATSEGDFHEALNFAAVFQRARWSSSCRTTGTRSASRWPGRPPRRRWPTRASGTAYAAEQVDGNDPVAMLAVLTAAVEHARAGNGPFLVEAHTYRMEPHTNADDASRYRDARRGRRAGGTGPDRPAGDVPAGDAARSTTRPSRRSRPRPRTYAADAADPDERRARRSTRWSLFDHVYAEPTPQLREQREQVRAELAADADGGLTATAT